MPINRRGFLSGILLASAAPAIVRASTLMPIYAPKQLSIKELVLEAELQTLRKVGFVYDADVSSMYAFERARIDSELNGNFYYFDDLVAVNAIKQIQPSSYY